MALYCSNLGILLYICVLKTSLIINTVSAVGSDTVKGEKTFCPTDTYDISK